MAEEAKIIVKNFGADEQFIKDALNEKELLDVLKDEKDIETEFSLLKKVYNEQLDALVRLRVDGEFFNWAVIAEPSDNENGAEKAKNDRAIKRKRKLIEVIRRQLKVMKEIQDNDRKEAKK